MSDLSDLDAQFSFTINLEEQRNNFALYLGATMLLLFLLILFVTFAHRRNFAAVVELSKPGKEWMVHEYLLVLTTSLRFGSSLRSQSRVSVQLKGAFHESKVFPLRQDLLVQKILHRGHTDIFVLHTPVDLGEIRSLVINISNWDLEKLCSWRPCFLEVIKSSTQERWGAEVSEPMICKSFITRTFSLKEAEREYRSFLKLLMLNHAWLSPFHNPQRFGAYSNAVNAIFFFFTQAVLLITTLSAYIYAHILTEDSLGMYSRSASDVFVCVLCGIAVLGFLQIFELFLRNIRPARRKTYKPPWSGLWQTEFDRDPTFFDIEFDWESSAFFVPRLPHKTSSKSSVISGGSLSSSSSSQCSSCRNPQASPRTARMSSEVTYLRITEKTVEDYVKVAMDETAGIKSMRTSSATQEWFDKHQPRKRRGKIPPFVWPRKFGHTEVEGLKSDGVPKMCFFCLWIKNLPVRGSTVMHYSTRLVHNVRRTFRALRACTSPELTSAVLLICIHQWLASLCMRMIQEAVVFLPKEDQDYEDLAFLVERLLEQQTILAYTEMGFRDVKPTESLDLLHDNKLDVKQHVMEVLEGERLTNMCSNTFFAILRYLTYVSSYYDHHVFQDQHEENANASNFPDPSAGGSIHLADVNISARREEHPSPKQRGDVKTSTSTSPHKTLFTRHLSEGTSEDRVTFSGEPQNTVFRNSDPRNFVCRRTLTKPRSETRGYVQHPSCDGSTAEMWRCVEDGRSANSLSDSSNSEDLANTPRLSRSPGRQWSPQRAHHSSSCWETVGVGIFQADNVRTGASAAVNTDQATVLFQDEFPLTCFLKFDQSTFKEESLQEICQGGFQMEPYSNHHSNERNDVDTLWNWQNFESNCAKHAGNENTVTSNDEFFAGVSGQMPESSCKPNLSFQRHRKTRFQLDEPLMHRKMFHRKLSHQEASECWNSNERKCFQGETSWSKGEVVQVKEDPVFVSVKNTKQCEERTLVQSDACLLETKDLGKGRGKKKGRASKPVVIQMYENPSIELETELSEGEETLPDFELRSRQDVGGEQGFTEMSSLHKRSLRGEGAHLSRWEFQNKISTRENSSAQHNDACVSPECEFANKILTDITEENRSNSSLYSYNNGDSNRPRGGSHEKYLVGRRHKNQTQGGEQKNGGHKKKRSIAFEDEVEEKGEPVANQNRSSKGSFSKVRSSQEYRRRFTNVWQELGVFGRFHRGPRVKLSVLRRLCNSFYACANKSFYCVQSGMGVSCVCCHLPVCHTYSVAFSLLGRQAGNVLTRLLSRVNAQLISDHLSAKPRRLSHRQSHGHSDHSHYHNQSYHQPYHQHRRSTHQSEHSYDPAGSSVDDGPSNLHAAWKTIEKDLMRDLYQELLLFTQSLASHKSKSHRNCNMSARSSSPSSCSRPGQGHRSGADSLLPAGPGDRCNHSRRNDLSSRESGDKLSFFELSAASNEPDEKESKKITEAVIKKAEEELSCHVSNLLRLKTSLAKAMAEAVTEILREMEDPIQVALRKFSHAKVVSLLHDLLPPDYEQDQIVSADEIRQRRQVRREVGAARYNLEGPPESPWDLELVEDVVEGLSARWMLNLRYNTHAYTLTFLARCLTLANLHQHGRKRPAGEVLGGQLLDSSLSLAVDCLSHAFEVEHKVAEKVDQVAGQTLALILPLALSVCPAVADALTDRDELLIYMCEMVSVLEQMSMARLSLAVIAGSSEAVQDEVIRLAWEKQELENYKKTIVVKKAAARSKSDILISIKEIRLIKKEMKYAQRVAETLIQRVENLRVQDLERHLKDTVKTQTQQVQQGLQVMVDARTLSGDTQGDYSLRALQEVEWVVTSQMRSPFPFLLMMPSVALMVILTITALVFTSLLASSLTPSTVGRWFGLHLLVVVFWGVVMEPLKLFWYMGLKRRHPEEFSVPEESWSSSSTPPSSSSSA